MNCELWRIRRIFYEWYELSNINWLMVWNHGLLYDFPIILGMIHHPN